MDSKYFLKYVKYKLKYLEYKQKMLGGMGSGEVEEPALSDDAKLFLGYMKRLYDKYTQGNEQKNAILNTEVGNIVELDTFKKFTLCNEEFGEEYFEKILKLFNNSTFIKNIQIIITKKSPIQNIPLQNSELNNIYRIIKTYINDSSDKDNFNKFINNIILYYNPEKNKNRFRCNIENINLIDCKLINEENNIELINEENNIELINEENNIELIIELYFGFEVLNNIINFTDITQEITNYIQIPVNNNILIFKNSNTENSMVFKESLQSELDLYNGKYKLYTCFGYGSGHFVALIFKENKWWKITDLEVIEIETTISNVDYNIIYAFYYKLNNDTPINYNDISLIALNNMYGNQCWHNALVHNLLRIKSFTDLLNNDNNRSDPNDDTNIIDLDIFKRTNLDGYDKIILNTITIDEKEIQNVVLESKINKVIHFDKKDNPDINFNLKDSEIITLIKYLLKKQYGFKLENESNKIPLYSYYKKELQQIFIDYNILEKIDAFNDLILPFIFDDKTSLV